MKSFYNDWYTFLLQIRKHSLKNKERNCLTSWTMRRSVLDGLLTSCLHVISLTACYGGNSKCVKFDLLTHCGLVMPYGVIDNFSVIIGSGNGLLPDSTKPLPEPVILFRNTAGRSDNTSVSAYCRTANDTWNLNVHKHCCIMTTMEWRHYWV